MATLGVFADTISTAVLLYHGDGKFLSCTNRRRKTNNSLIYEIRFCTRAPNLIMQCYSAIITMAATPVQRKAAMCSSNIGMQGT